MVIKTEINIGDKTVPLEFSFMTNWELENAGYSLPKIQTTANDNYLNILVEIVKAAAKVAARSNDDVLTIYDVAKWIDENGLSSETVQDVYAKFIQHASGEGVPKPKNEIAVKPQRVQKKTKATPPKK